MFKPYITYPTEQTPLKSYNPFITAKWKNHCPRSLEAFLIYFFDISCSRKQIKRERTVKYRDQFSRGNASVDIIKRLAKAEVYDKLARHLIPHLVTGTLSPIITYDDIRSIINTTQSFLHWPLEQRIVFNNYWMMVNENSVNLYPNIEVSEDYQKITHIELKDVSSIKSDIEDYFPTTGSSINYGPPVLRLLRLPDTEGTRKMFATVTKGVARTANFKTFDDYYSWVDDNQESIKTQIKENICL